MDELREDQRRMCNDCKKYMLFGSFPFADKYLDHRPYWPYKCGLCAHPEDGVERYSLLPKIPPMDARDGWVEAIYRWFDEDATYDEKVAFEDALAKRQYPPRPGTEHIAAVEAQKLLQKVSLEVYSDPMPSQGPAPKPEPVMKEPAPQPVKLVPAPQPVREPRLPVVRRAPVPLVGEKHCAACDQNHPLHMFGQRNGKPVNHCKKCVAAAAKLRRQS